MEQNTPERNSDTSFNRNLTPVRFLESPKVTPADINLPHIKARLDTIVATLKDNYQKWHLAHGRGQSLCSSIEALKTRALEDKNAICLYPNVLKGYCHKLAIITTIFVDITRNASESLKQLRSMSKIPACSQVVFYRTWTIQAFQKFVESLVYFYECETKVKQHVMRELAHCASRGELVRCCTAWEYPQYVDHAVDFMFAALGEETNTNTKK